MGMIEHHVETAERIASAWSVGRLLHVPVSITGETGTGKEHVARMIAERADLKFHAVNLSSLAESMIAAELFGHERGAFTGATKARPGVFEAASGGVLLIDEVGKASLGAQSSILRAIDSREVTRVGGSSPRRVSCAVIIAASEDVGEEIKAGRFLSDLWERVGVRLHIPSLRARPGKAEELVELFAARYGVEVDSDVYEWARGYEWPGNVREVLRTVEACALLSGRVTLAECVNRTESGRRRRYDMGVTPGELSKMEGVSYQTAYMRLRRGVSRGDWRKSGERYYRA